MMRRQDGFGYIGILITLAIIVLIVWGTFYMSGSSKKNQIQQSQDEIQKAKDAAKLENDYNQSIQDQIQSIDNSGVNYGAARNSAEKLLK